MAVLTEVPLRLSTVDPGLGIFDGAENQDAANAVGDILEEHRDFFPDIKHVYNDDPILVDVWPSFAIEWVRTEYTRPTMGRNCDYEALIELNVWFYRDGIDTGLNNEVVRTNLSLMTKVLLTHRGVNGFAQRGELMVTQSISAVRPRDNQLFDAGFLTAVVPRSICIEKDITKGPEELNSIEC